MTAQHSKWRQDGDVTAACVTYGCHWRYRAHSLSTVTRQAKQHVEETGHKVERTRTQWSITEPQR